MKERANLENYVQDFIKLKTEEKRRVKNQKISALSEYIKHYTTFSSEVYWQLDQ
jgi:hypothetical protein